jgi:hypothetical protein
MIAVSQGMDADFNFPKIQLISHRVKQIGLYRSVQHYTAERREEADPFNLRMVVRLQAQSQLHVTSNHH